MTEEEIELTDDTTWDEAVAAFLMMSDEKHEALMQKLDFLWEAGHHAFVLKENPTTH